MERYGTISSVTFGSTTLSFPVGVRLLRRAEPLPVGGDADKFATSVQLRRPAVVVEVRTRDVAAAESCSPGQAGALAFVVSPTRSSQKGRRAAIGRAVLTDIEVQYEQAAPAVAKLTFLAEAIDGATDPFSSQEAP